MDINFHYLMMISNTMFNREVVTELQKYGLTPGQPKVLDYLFDHDGAMQKEIALKTFTDVATLTGILTKMEEKGLIERKTKNGNRRSFCIYLTEKGWEKAKNVKQTFIEKEEKALNGITPSEREEFLKTTEKICGNLINMEEFKK